MRALLLVVAMGAAGLGLAACAAPGRAASAAATPSATACASPGQFSPRARPSGAPGTPPSGRAAAAASGQVTAISGRHITVSDRRAGATVIVITDASTTVRRGTAAIKVSDIKAGESIVVMGTTEADGTVLATSIVVPARSGCLGGRRNLPSTAPPPPQS